MTIHQEDWVILTTRDGAVTKAPVAHWIMALLEILSEDDEGRVVSLVRKWVRQEDDEEQTKRWEEAEEALGYDFGYG